MKKYLNKLSDKTAKLNKTDYIIMAVMILIYGILSFYHLGDTKSPQTYYQFQDIGDSITISLDKEYEISKMMYYTGNNISNIDIMISSDNKTFYDLNTFTTYYVFAWESTNLNTKARALKFVSRSEDATLGDIALYDAQGRIIKINKDDSNPLIDELELVPEMKSYLNSSYFDEIYHARCAYEYVNGIDCFEWSHPPLGKLIIAIPILIFGYSPFNARLMGNIAGILLIPVMYILCKKIFKNRKYAFLGGILMMFDTFHFAHTRIALIDGFQLLFILLSVIFMKNYLDLEKNDSFKKKTINLLLSGFFIGCAIATKWNALYPALGLAIVFFMHLLKQYNINIIKYCKSKLTTNNIIKLLLLFILIPLLSYYIPYLLFNGEVARIILIIYLSLILTRILIGFFKLLINDYYLLKLFAICALSFILIPTTIYILSYILFPNVNYYDRTLLGIVEQTKLMYDYHSNLVASHPFSSTWYQWPIMYKPVWLYTGEVINMQRTTIVDIGNPAIWWFGIIAFIYILISSIKKNCNSNFILIFILSSFIPYIFIGRIMFMYHYFITLPFIMLGIVAFIKWLTEKLKTDKVYWIYISFVMLLFLIFFPVVSGMVVSEDYIDALKWFSSWQF